jgi:twitching motility protein PilT
MAWLDPLFQQMIDAGASDLHLSATRPPMFRIDGDMQIVDGFEPTTPERMTEILREITPERNQLQFEQEWDTDFAHAIPGLARFRANLFFDQNGPGAVFRAVPSKVLSPAELGLPKVVTDLCRLRKGLALVTGPTGSGKSTTLAAMIDHVNATRTDHIITIEDPIEFVHGQKRCLINQREVHRHTGSFKQALRAALREDPDVVLVGELRDVETIEIALETAETGHLVFATLHTSTAISTIDRIIDQFPTDRQSQIRTMLASSLKGVIAMNLCKRRPTGRIAALEILMVTNAVANLIREGKTHQIASVMQTGSQLGMRLLNDSLFELVQSGQVEPMEGYLKSVSKIELVKKYEQAKIGFDEARSLAELDDASERRATPRS